MELPWPVQIITFVVSKDSQTLPREIKSEIETEKMIKLLLNRKIDFLLVTSVHVATLIQDVWFADTEPPPHLLLAFS